MTVRLSEAVALTSPPGFTLRGRLSFAGRPAPHAVLFVHGYGGESGGLKAKALEEECARRGRTFAAFDFRGHAASSGTLADLRASALQQDLDTIFAFLHERGVDRLDLVGSSMGGFASAWFARRRPELVGALALVAPAFDFLQRMPQRLADAAAWERWRQTRRLAVRNMARGADEELDFGLVEEIGRYPAEELAANWRHPALIFHSVADETVPFAGCVELLCRTPPQAVLELRLFRDGDHRDPTDRVRLAEAALSFFERHAEG